MAEEELGPGPPRSARATSSFLHPVTASTWGLEYSVHSCPRRHRDDVKAVFPTIDVDDVLIIPTCQRAEVDLVRPGGAADAEKDRLLERFVRWARALAAALAARGHWADLADPCSGLPMLTRARGGAPYDEAGAAAALLGHRLAAAGCCKVALHPRWGSAAYPATAFARAPLGAVLAAVADVERALGGGGGGGGGGGEGGGGGGAGGAGGG